MELAEEVLMKPKFAEEDFQRLKQQQLEGIKSSRKNPSSIANQAYNRLLYGKDHIYAIPTGGDEGSVSNITLDDVKDFSVKGLEIDGAKKEKEIILKDCQNPDIENLSTVLKIK